MIRSFGGGVECYHISVDVSLNIYTVTIRSRLAVEYPILVEGEDIILRRERNSGCKLFTVMSM